MYQISGASYLVAYTLRELSDKLVDSTGVKVLIVPNPRLHQVLTNDKISDMSTPTKSAGVKDEEKPSLFVQLKPTCLALLKSAVLTPQNSPQVAALLKDLLATLRSASACSRLSQNIVSYVFFPLSTLLRRNETHALPDSVLENIFNILSILAQTWWWSCELELWDQLLILASGILAGVPASQSRAWGNETKDAILTMVLSLLFHRQIDDDTDFHNVTEINVEERLETLVRHGQSARMVPVLGSILNEVLPLCLVQDRVLQSHSVQLTRLLVDLYIHEDLAPAILPGVVSTSLRVALGSNLSRGWAGGDVASAGLDVIRLIVLKAMNDKVCLKQGIVGQACSLDELAELVNGSGDQVIPPDPSSSLPRTSSWLRASASQIHIALNSLSPLTQHSSVKTLEALLRLSLSLLREARLTLTQSVPLLLSFVLTLASSPISVQAFRMLSSMLEDRESAAALQEPLLNISHANISSLPRAISLKDDTKVEHLASQLGVIGDLLTNYPRLPNIFAHLLGPSGGIEKWGWNILCMLELIQPPDNYVGGAYITIPQLLSGEAVFLTQFPMLSFKNVASRSGYDALERMFQNLARVGGHSSLYSIEWFSSTAFTTTGSTRSTALWCTARLMEGYANVYVNSEGSQPLLLVPKQMERLARVLARSIGETWDEGGLGGYRTESANERQDIVKIEFTSGLHKFETKLDLLGAKNNGNGGKNQTGSKVGGEVTLVRTLYLHNLSVLSAALGASFQHTLQYTLYPVLHSLTSVSNFLRTSGIAALQHIAYNSAYASTSNFLLANFDYALDAISQRLSRSRLDIDAARILAMLVSLAGKDIVIKAEDIVEECFDRLDDFHGYGTVVEGLMDVLVKVIEGISVGALAEGTIRTVFHPQRQEQPAFRSFSSWYKQQIGAKEFDKEGASEPPPRTDWAHLDNSNIGEHADFNINNEEEEKPASPTHRLAKQILERSIPFLTHKSPLIKTRVLSLMSSSVPILVDRELLLTVHIAWPYVMNRLTDSDATVVTATAIYIEALSQFSGDFMSSRVWEDVWPRFKKLLKTLELSERESALRCWDRSTSSNGTLSAFTDTHRLLRAILHTVSNAIRSTIVPHDVEWDVAVTFRRFLQSSYHVEVQSDALTLYNTLHSRSPDMLWLVFSATAFLNTHIDLGNLMFLRQKWDVKDNVIQFLESPMQAT